MQDRNNFPMDDDLQRWYRAESCWNCEQPDRPVRPGRMRQYRIRLRRR